MKLLISVLLALTFNTYIAKDTGTIKGKVFEIQSNTPLVEANVVLEGTNFGIATKIDGSYEIKNIPIGIYNLKASYIGYESKIIQKIDVKNNKTVIINIALTPALIETEECIVISRKPKFSRIATSCYSSVSPNYLSKRYYSNYDTEEYDKINENIFYDAAQTPLSTFSIDVDCASYSNVRRFITRGNKPPKDAVRIEELVNYFTYDYPQPNGNNPFSITTELSSCPWEREHQLVLVGLQGKNIETENLPPSNLVFLIDVSGSMSSQNKLPLLKNAFRLLVNQLRKNDRVAIVVYAGNAGLVLPSTPGNNKEKILEAIEKLNAGGSTAGGQGIKLAYKIAKKNFIYEGNNRVILATDGDFNVGISSDNKLIDLIEEKRNDGIFLSILGFGTGNYKDSKMEKLADKGNGNYNYIDNILEAKKVLVSQMAGTLFTIAKDVKIQIEFNPKNVSGYRLIGYENRLLNKEDFNNDKKDAGELGAGHSVTALYEIIPVGSKSLPIVDKLKYQSKKDKTISKFENEILTVKFRYKEPNGTKSKLIIKTLNVDERKLDKMSNNLKFASSVIEFGMLLRNSDYKGTANFDDILHLAKSAKGNDKEGYRSEFIRLVETCQLSNY